VFFTRTQSSFIGRRKSVRKPRIGKPCHTNGNELLNEEIIAIRKLRIGGVKWRRTLMDLFTMNGWDARAR
jgi:hypothetical protein